MDRKRIVIFIESFGGGGAERVLYTLLRNIDKKRFDITVLVMSDTGAQREKYHQLDVKIVNVLSHKSNLLNKIKYNLLYHYLPAQIALYWILRKVTADTYVAFVEGYCTKIFSYLSHQYKKIAWVHIDLDSFPWTTELGIFKNISEEVKAYQRYDTVVCVSQGVTDVMKAKYNISNITTIYNPVDEARIKNLSIEPSILNIDKSKFNLVSVGRLTKQKGYDKLISCVPELIRGNANIRLYIIGEGEERNSLQKLIAELKIEEYVVLTGFLENPYAVMNDMDLFVCSSVAEGFSLVIAEAMIVGLPVVSMECSGPSELLGYGKYGILCNNYDSLKEAIIKISTDHNLFSSLRKQASVRGQAFNTETSVNRIAEIIK